MGMLVHLGEGVWVSPDEIAAIHWPGTNHPAIELKGGARIYATGYSREHAPGRTRYETEAECTQRLVDHIMDKVNQAAARAFGYVSRYPDTGPASSDSEGSRT